MLHPLRRLGRQIASFLCLAVAAACVLPPALAQTLPKGVTLGPSMEGITEYRLDNGLKVLLFPDASRPTVVVNITYLVGSRHEGYGESGMAHLLEHLLFKGTPKNPQPTREFMARGMQWNGTTSVDRTNYFATFQASDDHLKWAIEFEADRMVNSFVAKKDLDAEMTVVRNEFERGENSALRVMIQRAHSIAYDWHNYGRATIGSRSDIENVKIENLQAFYRTWYRPDNAVLLVAGKFDPAKALPWIAGAFGKIPKPARRMPEAWTQEPVQDGERSFRLRRKGEEAMVLVAYKVPPATHEDYDAASVAAGTLTATPHGPLHKLLVETGKATRVFQFAQPTAHPGLIILGASVRRGGAVDEVRDIIVRAAEENFAPPAEEDIARLQRNSLNTMERAMADPQRVGVAMSNVIALGDWRFAFYARDRLSAITAEQAAAAAARYFRRDNRTVGTLVPDDEPRRAEMPPAPDLAALLKDYRGGQAIAAGEEFDPAPDKLEARTRRLKIGGIDVGLLQRRTRGQTVTVALSMHAGDEASLRGKRPVAQFVPDMLMRGAGEQSRAELADAFSKLKISGSPRQFQTVRGNLEDALRTVARVLRQPTFPEGEFRQLQTQLAATVRARRNDPQALAMDALESHFNRYPRGDWRAHMTIDEQVAALMAVKLADVKEYHKTFFGTSKAELAIVGDFDADAVTKLVGELFGDWPAAPYARLPAVHTDVEPMRRAIDTPDKANGFFVAALPVPLREDDPDASALSLANYLFGGAGMDSRLMRRIRQADGLSYSGGSSLSMGALDRAGRFTVSAIAAPQNLGRLEAAVFEEIERVRRDGFTAAELAAAKAALRERRQQSRAQDGVLANALLSQLYHGRDFSWLRRVDERTEAATLAEVNAAFRKHVDPARMSVVVAGDAARMKPAQTAQQ